MQVEAVGRAVLGDRQLHGAASGHGHDRLDRGLAERARADDLAPACSRSGRRRRSRRRWRWRGRRRPRAACAGAPSAWRLHDVLPSVCAPVVGDDAAAVEEDVDRARWPRRSGRPGLPRRSSTTTGAWRAAARTSCRDAVREARDADHAHRALGRVVHDARRAGGRSRGAPRRRAPCRRRASSRGGAARGAAPAGPPARCRCGRARAARRRRASRSPLRRPARAAGECGTTPTMRSSALPCARTRTPMP